MVMETLQEAIDHVLCCPLCKGTLILKNKADSLDCIECGCTYPINDGIPIFIKDNHLVQEEERLLRERVALNYICSNQQAILAALSHHHCVPVMQRHAERFQREFKPSEWILDIGIGWGWHWVNVPNTVRLIGIDMSIGNLRIAQRLLNKNGISATLLCADAATLPIKEKAVSGVWSVQVFQHFSEELLLRVQNELERVLDDTFIIEMYNLNRPLFHKTIYKILSKKFHCRGRLGEMELNRFSAKEWRALWCHFRNGCPEIRHYYSEIFFHPDLRFRPKRYPVRAENIIAKYTPRLAKLFARQVQLRIEAL